MRVSATSRNIKYAENKLYDGETANGDLVHMDHQGAITQNEPTALGVL